MNEKVGLWILGTIFIIWVLLALLTSCTKNDDAPPLPPKPKGARPIVVDNATELEVGTPRFKVESHGKFESNMREREILIITDLDTGKSYLGITGVGISELVTKTETSVTIDAKGHPQVHTTTTTGEE